MIWATGPWRFSWVHVSSALETRPHLGPLGRLGGPGSVNEPQMELLRSSAQAQKVPAELPVGIEMARYVKK